MGRPRRWAEATEVFKSERSRREGRGRRMLRAAVPAFVGGFVASEFTGHHSAEHYAGWAVTAVLVIVIGSLIVDRLIHWWDRRGDKTAP